MQDTQFNQRTQNKNYKKTKNMQTNRQNKLNSYVKGLTYDDYQTFRKKVIEECKIHRNTYNGWVNKTCPRIAVIYKEKINEIAWEMFNEKIF